MASHSVLCSQKVAPAMGMVAELQAKLQKNKKDLVPSKPAVKTGAVDVAVLNGKVAKLPTKDAATAAVRDDINSAARRFDVASPPAVSHSANKQPVPGAQEGRRPPPSNLRTELRKTTSNVTLGGNIQGSDGEINGSRRSFGGEGKELTTVRSHGDVQRGLTVLLEQPSPPAFGYQNVFDDPQPRASNKDKDRDTALQKKKPIPIPRKSSTTDTQALVGGGPSEEEGGGEESSSRDTPTGAALQLSKSLNDLDGCSNVNDATGPSAGFVQVKLRHQALCVCKSAEDMCVGTGTPPTKPRPLPGKWALAKTISDCPALSAEAAPPEVRNRACSEGDLIAPPLNDDEYVQMDPTTTITSSPAAGSHEYLKVLPAEEDVDMYMDMSLEVFGKGGSPPSAAMTSSDVRAQMGREQGEGKGRGYSSSPPQPSTPGSDASSCQGEVGGTKPPIVPQRPTVTNRSESSSPDEYLYSTIPSKKYFVSTQTPDSPKEAPPTKREVTILKPPDPPPKSKSLLREVGVLLMEHANNKKPDETKSKSTAVVKETTKKEGPRVEPYSSKNRKSPSPVKMVAKASATGHMPVKLAVSQSSSESDFESTNAWGLKKALSPRRPPPPKASRTRVYDQNIYDSKPVDNSREEPSEQQEAKRGVRGKGLNKLHTKIDRTSLLVIMENREAIFKQLGLGSCDPSTGEGSAVDILGTILGQIDSLLSRRLYSERELIAAIETHLNIRLSSPQASERDKEGEEVGKGKETRMVLTDQDVERVNQLVRNSCFEDDSEPEGGGGGGDEMVRSEVNDEADEVTRKVSQDSIKASQDASQDSIKASQDASQDSIKASQDSDSDCEYVSSVTVPSSPPAVRKPHSLSLSNLEICEVRVAGGGVDRRPSTLADDVINTTFSWDSGCGTFTEKGGLLTKFGSGVRVDIPQGAIPRDKRQQLWLEAKDTFAIEDPMDATCPLQGSPALCITRGNELESHIRNKADTLIQLSPTVEVGPSDAMFFKALRVTIPHCLSLKSLGWNIHVEGRVSPSGEWLRLPKSHANMLSCKSKAGLFWNSSYQLHMNHVTVHTSQLGSFRLVGCPIMKGARSGKKMLASVYTRCQGEEEESACVPVSVFIINDIQDHSEVRAMCVGGQQSISVPV